MSEERFTNNEGRTFTVRIVPTGDVYGLNGCLVNDRDPMVEFYDATYDVPKFWEVDSLTKGRGQFVSRYYIDTLDQGNTGHGLDLCGHVQEWKIDAATMDRIMDWVALHERTRRQQAIGELVDTLGTDAE